MTLECEQQNLLEYEETDTDGILTVAENSARTQHTPPGGPFSATLAQDFITVSGANPLNWGMKFDNIVHNSGFGGGGNVLGIRDTGHDNWYLGCGIVYYGAANFKKFGLYHSSGLSISSSYAHGTNYTLKFYCYVLAGTFYRTLEIYSGDSLLETVEHHITPARTPNQDDLIIRVVGTTVQYYETDQATSNVWLPVGGAVLPMIRNQSGTLGKQLIR